MNKSRLLQKGMYPNAPYISDTKAWSEIMIKRLLKRASDEGFDYVTFPNGSLVESLVAMRDGGKDYYDNHIVNYVKDIVNKIDTDSYLGTYIQQRNKILDKGMKTLSLENKSCLKEFPLIMVLQQKVNLKN